MVQVNHPSHGLCHDSLVGFVIISEEEVKIQQVSLPIDLPSFQVGQVRFLRVWYALVVICGLGCGTLTRICGFPH